ncbi:MAG: DNA replication and repair protein RecF [Desulfuromusa sp.]|jgi:DNA replication and repair protein RecF|nr:DNA replication and repair protein RecF [Desulfuromusa sp.]
MHINKIIINNFRNIENTVISPSDKINFIYGQNAQGKTNLLESIYFSSLYKSFRTNKNTNLINKDYNSFNINLEIINNNVNNNIKIFLDNKNKKNIIINNKKPDNDFFYKILNCIIYYPDEIIYLKTYPLYRRNLIDRSIFFINNEYIYLFKKYLKCLKQRNIFLKLKKCEDDVWRDQLIEYASLIIEERMLYIDKINEILSSFENLKIKENYLIEYKKIDKKEIKDNLYKKFKKNEIKEKQYGYTLFGPHIDDFIFTLNGSDINKYCSEGQKRSFLLCYKQAQLQHYKNIYGYYPVLLFDDIGTELDLSRKTNIFNKIIENSGQVFITTIDIPNMKNENIKVFKVDNGSFSEFILK